MRPWPRLQRRGPSRYISREGCPGEHSTRQNLHRSLIWTWSSSHDEDIQSATAASLVPPATIVTRQTAMITRPVKRGRVLAIGRRTNYGVVTAMASLVITRTRRQISQLSFPSFVISSHEHIFSHEHYFRYLLTTTTDSVPPELCFLFTCLWGEGGGTSGLNMG